MFKKLICFKLLTVIFPFIKFELLKSRITFDPAFYLNTVGPCAEVRVQSTIINATINKQKIIKQKVN